MTHRSVFALSLLFLLAGANSATLATEDRVVAIGDIHGAYDGIVSILREAGLIDQENKWIGETATLVQTGDFLDRGSRVREVMDLLMSLQEQATRQGGRVVILLGNHEVFNLMGDLADVSPDAFAAFSDTHSETRRAAAYADYERWSERQAALLEAAQIPLESEADWLMHHPPGLLEYMDAIGPGGRYGRWLRSLPAIARVGDTLFMHGGLAPEFTESDEDSINRQMSRRNLPAGLPDRYRYRNRSLSLGDRSQRLHDTATQYVFRRCGHRRVNRRTPANSFRTQCL